MLTPIELLKDNSTQLVTASNIEILLNQFIQGIVQLIETTQIILVTCNHPKKTVNIEKTYGLEGYQPKAPKIQWTNEVNKWLFQGGEILALTEEGSSQFLMLLEPEENHFFQCEIRIPLFVKKQLFGIISLGPKKYGQEYTTENIDVLQILINLVTLALERFVDNELSKLKINATDSQEKNGKSLQPQPLQVQPTQIKVKRFETPEEILGKSPAMQMIDELIEKVATKDVTILITGESGTGKELVAQKIHLKSTRNTAPLITMNCAALPEHLVESELFGHEKGAFTNAYTLKKGRFEIANNSTLFLDEIGEMSLDTQAKLLRVLQFGTFQRIGSSKTMYSNVRIIAATNKNLEEEIQKGTFRQDLFYRLNVVQIPLPPLRERKEDVLLLANHFIKRFSEYYDKIPGRLSDSAKQKLINYSFPGNIRELQNIIERAVIMEKSESIFFDFLPNYSNHVTQPASAKPNDKITLGQLEKLHIAEILKSVNYNKSRASKILGIARKTLREKIQKYNIQTQ